MNQNTQHTFHIPVMGLAYTIDSPVKVARYGISSVMSIGEDRLVEMMRNHYLSVLNRKFIPISHSEPDYRARRITAYLDLVNEIVNDQMAALKNSEFEEGSEITKYFSLLPDTSPLKLLYNNMLVTKSPYEKSNMQETLRMVIESGSIDVNIMTKTDRNNYDKEGNQIEDGSDAVAALRGYANSKLKNSGVVFSAGLNPRLFSYLEKLTCFLPDEHGEFVKKIIIKVSDFRSAMIQGKYLAKKGIWVSEFRVESGLNCGGHAFATDGYLLGPILEEFHDKQKELKSELFELYKNALTGKGINPPLTVPSVKFTVQGGIGTADEDQFLRKHYGLDSTGWGTPFLLVPEATTVDEETISLLANATKEQVVLSHNSPLGVRYYYLKGTSAEMEKQQRILEKRPGSPCTEKHLAFNTEFTKDPICTASKTYQKLKLKNIRSQPLSAQEIDKQVEMVVSKECLCVGLSNSASKQYQVPFIKNLKAVTICPGPNIVNFKRVVPLRTMVDHIYGRTDILSNHDRPHMFITELRLYIDFLKEMLQTDPLNHNDNKKISYYKSFFTNLLNGVSYYRELHTAQAIRMPSFSTMLKSAENVLKEMQEFYLRKTEEAVLVKVNSF